MVSSKNLKVKSFINSLAENLNPHAGYLIAYSGGADSTALLHLFANAISAKNIRAIHINHGIQSQAHSWEDHCQKTCNQLNIHLIVERANLPDTSENSCRIARYDFFAKHLKPNETLLTAHHAEDQAETVLLKLMRGTGIKGLCGIEKRRQFSHGYIARPLLDISPLDLKNYLIENKLPWIEDDSNLDNKYKRNFLRNNIIPSLSENFTNVVENISRSANNNSQSLELLHHLCDFKNKYLPIQTLKDLPESLQPTLLYHWLSDKNLPTPDKAVLMQTTHDFIHAKADKHPHYKNRYYQLFRWQDSIYCIKNYETTNSDMEFRWSTEKAFECPNGCGTLEYKGKEHLDLTIRFNQKGQKLQTHKHQFSKTIKKLFQENKVPTWERQNTPFIYHNDELVSLGYEWSHDSHAKNSIAFKKGKYQL